MALTTCKECGKEISGSAKACPHCGVAAPGKKHISGGAGLLVIVGALLLFNHLGGEKKTAVATAPAVVVEKTSEQIRAEEVQKCFSSRDGSHDELTRTIKAGMKNPDSYKHVETRYVDNGTHLLVVTQYRGTNSFGAVVTETISAETLLNCQVKRILKE